jgi:5-methylthioadenosine/S-adenosylhomocysteine deaminase
MIMADMAAGACSPGEPRVSLLIRDATIITVDPAERVISNGAVLIEGRHIADLGSVDDVLSRHATPARILSGAGKVLIPGFVSAHTHVGYTMFRGRAEDTGFDAITRLYVPMAAVVTRAERLAIGSLTYAELLRSGVTTVLNMEEDGDVYGTFVEALGIRSDIGVLIHDVPLDAMRRGEIEEDESLGLRQIGQASAFASAWNGRGSGRITTRMTPNFTTSSSASQLRQARAIADRLGIGMSLHLAWGQQETNVVAKAYGCSPVAHAYHNGVLARDVVAGHLSSIDEHDLALFARSGACVGHCPLQNAVRAHIAPAQAMLRHGIKVGLGIDNMFADFFEVVRAAVLMARVRSNDTLAPLAMYGLRLATMGGAEALGMEGDIGSIEIGKRADLVLLHMRGFGLTPVLDPVQNLVYHAHATHVHAVLVDGEILVEGGELKTVDAQALVDGAEEAARTAWRRFEAIHGSVHAH